MISSSLLLVVAFLVSIFPLSAVHGQTMGTVCIESSTVSDCATTPTIPGPTSGSVTVDVNIQGSANFSAFNIFVKTDNAILTPTMMALGPLGTSLSGFTLLECINGAKITGIAPSCSPQDGPGVASWAQSGIVLTNHTGTLLTVTYDILTKTTGTLVGFQTGCTNLSSPGFCVQITNGSNGATQPENIQTATFFNQAPPPNFSLSAFPTSGTAVQGSTTSTVITATTTSGAPGSVSFSTSTLPSGVTAAFSPTSCTPTCSSTLTFTASTAATTGTATVTVTGAASGIAPVTTTYSLTVQQPPKDFSITANPSTLTPVQGGVAQISTLSISGINGFTDTVNLVQVEAPTGGPTISLTPASLMLSTTSSSASAFLSISAGLSTPLGQYTVTVNATGATTGKSQVVTVFATVVAPAQSADFAISTNPTNLFIQPGSTARAVIVLRSLNGFAGTVNLASNVSPVGPSSSLSRISIVLTAGGYWALVLSVSTTTSTSPGNYTVVVTATSGSISHSALVSVTVF